LRYSDCRLIRSSMVIISAMHAVNIAAKCSNYNIN
jgi:hypothetical protein